MAKITTPHKEATQEVFSYPDLEFDKSALFIQEWIEEGREEGREEGIQIGAHKALCSVTLRLLHRALGEIDEVTQERIRALPNHRLEELGGALLDFNSLDDLRKWLSDAPDQSPVG
ncbi:MAG: DUF4351 domain-containing protein [Blastocatellia bacterium]